MSAEQHPLSLLLEKSLTRRAAVVGGATLAAVPVLARPAAGQEASPAPVSGGVLRVGVQGDPTELDPHLVVLDAASLIVDLVSEGLVHEDAALVPQPALAESWEISADGTVYTFALRQGVTFHNGRALVAGDVVYSIERVMNPDTASPWVSYTGAIASVEAPDDATVVFTLSAPDASFLANLCRRGLSVVPQEEVEANGDLRQVMVGTGPFTFTEYVPNSQITLGRNADYWDAGKPYLDGLEIQIIPEDTARTTALVSNTVDFIEFVPHKDIMLVDKEPALVLAGDQATNLRWIVFNLRREPFDNPEFRRAVAQGIDRQPIIDSAVFGYGTPLLGLYPSGFWAGYDGDLPEADMEGAAAAIGELTLPEGFRPQILSWAQYDFLNNTTIVFQEQLRQMGIESDIDPQENAIYLERFFGGDFDIAVMGAAGYLDPNDFMKQSLGTGETNNAAGYSNPELDDLLAQGLAEQDQEARVEIYQQAQQVIIDDAPWIALYTSNTYEGMRLNVRGYTHSLSGSLKSLAQTWLME
jgi:peptide/nickel transport system substrate-binding protein